MTAPLVEVVIAGNPTSYLEAIDSSASATEDAVGRLDTAAAGMSDALDTSAGSADALAGSLKGAGSSAGEAAASVDTAADSMGGSISDLFKLTDILDDDLKHIGTTVESVAASWDAGTDDMVLATQRVIDSSQKVIDSVEEQGATIDETSETSSGFLDGLSDVLDKLSGKFGIVGEMAGKMGESIDASSAGADTSLSGVAGEAEVSGGAMGKVGKAGVAGLVVLGAAAIDLGQKYQGLTTNIAAWGGISVGAAGKITQAFLGTAGSTMYSAQEIAKSYGGVVGQLTAVEGHSLNSKQAMQVMSAAMDLAEGSGESLGSATSALSKVMQTFQMKTGDARTAADQLFSTAKGAGVPLSQVAQSVQQVHTQLGSLTPPLGQTGALLVDMVEHGMNGSRAMRVLGTSLNSLLKPSENIIEDQKKLKIATDALPPSLQHLASEYQNNQISAQAATTQAQTLGTQSALLWSHFTAASGTVSSANLALKQSGDSALFVNGKFVGLGKAIGILHDQTKGMTDQQKLARLAQDGLQSSAAKLLPVIDAGSKAFDHASSEVNKTNAAHEAAQKQAQTLDHQFDTLKSMVDDYVTSLGTRLIPIVTNVMKVFVDLTSFLTHNKDVMLALASIIGGVLVTAIGLWVAGMVRAAVVSSAATAKQLWEDAQTVASNARKVASFVAASAGIIAGWVAQAAAATAAFIAENAATLGIIAGIALLVGAVIFLATHWKEVWHDILVVVDGAVNFVKSHMKEVGIALILVLGPIGALIVGITLLATHWKVVFNTIKDAAVDAWHFLDSDVIQPIEHAFSDLINEIKSHWHGLLEILIAPFAPFLAIFLAFHSDIIKGFKDIIHDIMGVFSGAATLLEDVGKNIVMGLIHGVEGAAKGAVDAVKKVGHDILSAAKSVLGIFSPSTETAAMGKHLIEGFIQGLNSGGTSQISAVFTKILNAISNEVNKDLTKVTANAKSFGVSFVAAFTKINESSAIIQKFGNTLLSDVGAALAHVSTLLTAFLASFDRLGDSLVVGREALTGFSASMADYAASLKGGGDAINDFGSSFSDVHDAMVSGLDEIGSGLDTFQGKITTTVSRLLVLDNGIHTLANDITNQFISRLNSTSGPLSSFGSGVNTKVVTPLGQADTAMSHFDSSTTQVVNAVNSIGSSFSGLNASSIISLFNGLGGKIMGALNSQNIPGQMYSFGQQMMSGLSNGINSEATNVANAAANAAQGALNAAKAKTNTHSPSLVFAELGKNFMEGLAMGVTGSAALAHAAVSAAVGGLAGVAPTGLSVSAGAARSGASGSSANTTIVLELNGQQLAQAILPDLQTVNLRTQKSGGRFTLNLT